MKTLAILIHGLNVVSGIGSLSKIKPFLTARGIDVVEFQYGYLWLGGAIEKNRTLGRMLGHTIDDAYENYDRVVVIGHSNGCSIMELATQTFRKCDGFVYLHPAIERRNAPGPKVGFTQVWYNRDDLVIKMCRWVYPFEWLRRMTQWGDMGVCGYKGSDPTVENNEVVVQGLSGFENHRAVFHRLAVYGPKILNYIQVRLQASEIHE